MRMKKVLLSTAAAVALLGMSTSAFAAWTTGSATAKIVNEAPAATKAAVAMAANPVYTVVAPGIPAGSTITLALTGGAVFPALPMATVVGAGVLGAGTLSATGASATWTVNTALAAGDTITFAIGNVDVSASPANTAVDLTLSAVTAAGVTTIAADSLAATVIGAAANGPIVQLVPAFSATVAPATDVATAGSGFTNFAATTNPWAGAVAPNVSGSQFVLNMIGETAGLGAVPSSNVTGTAGITDQLLVTLSGDFNGVVGVNSNGLAPADATGAAPAAGAAPAVGVFLINAAKTQATAMVVGWPAVGPAGSNYFMNVVFDGVTALTTRTFNVSVAHTQVAGASLFAAPLAGLAPTPAYTVIRGGSNFTLNRIGPNSTIKITENSGNAAVVAGITYQAFDAAGAPLAAAAGAALPATLPANSTVTVTGAALRAAFGPTLSSLRIFVESSNVLVTHRQANARGLTISGISSGTNGL